MASNQVILETINLEKSFGAVHAVRTVSWKVYQGRVNALVGDNGAGKSTLIKLISGALAPNAGGFRVRGQETTIGGPAGAFDLGIAAVYQDLALVENRDVVMNMFLGSEMTRGLGAIFLDHKGMLGKAHDVLNDIHARIPNVREMVRNLSGGQRQAVAVGRALIRGGEIIIMDEPTAALGVEQTQEVLQLIGMLRNQGKTIILISHNIQQVFEIADYISVMFHGELLGTRPKEEATEAEVVAMIMGKRSALTEK